MPKLISSTRGTGTDKPPTPTKPGGCTRQVCAYEVAPDACSLLATADTVSALGKMPPEAVIVCRLYEPDPAE